MYDVLRAGYAPFFLIDVPDDDSIRSPEGTYLTLETWKKPAGFTVDLEKVTTKFNEWVLKANARVKRELAQIIQPDTLQTITGAFDPSFNRWKISPMTALNNIILFLEKNPPKADDLAFTKVYADTLDKLKKIHTKVVAAVATKELATPVEEVYELAQLKFGTVVIETRLDMILRLTILTLIENSTPDDQALVAQLLAANRFNDTLTRASGSDGLSGVRRDIGRAKPYTIKNLNSFLEIFGDNIERILRKLIQEEEASKKTVAASFRYARTEMCFLLLGVPDFGSSNLGQYCEGLKFTSQVAGGPESEVLTSEVMDADYNDRACAYRDYFRKSRIFDTWGIK